VSHPSDESGPEADDGEGVGETPGETDSGSTRRRILQAAGGLGLVGVLGIGGWIRRIDSLGKIRDRTDLISRSSATGGRVSGPSSETVPADMLSAAVQRASERRADTGLQAAVIFDDGTVWHGVAGEADHGDSDPLTHEDHLYIGSITKLFTATLVTRRVQRGATSLSDTVDEWLDLEYADDVTVRMLLNHTSGVPNYTEDLWFGLRYFARPSKRWTPGELVDVVRGKPLNFAPGSRHRYSNSNYVLLGRILERVTGSPYSALVRSLVREELAYDRTYYLDYPDETVIANAYDESIFGFGRQNLTAFRTSMETGAYAAGGILSTAPDIASFVRSVFDGRVLDEDVLSEMRTFVDAPDKDVPAQVEYGLGIRHLRIDDEDLYGHTGTIPGYSAIAMHHDEPRYTIAVIGNVSTIAQAEICGALQRVVLDERYRAIGSE
jgi:D-alanyl-D-alanine carboxypeptidase